MAKEEIRREVGRKKNAWDRRIGKKDFERGGGQKKSCFGMEKKEGKCSYR